MFVGVVHRIDRPVGGLVIFAKTSKALARLNEMLRKGEIHKTYWAVTRNMPANPEGLIHGYIRTVERSNKSYFSTTPKDGAKEAKLSYRLISSSDRYHLLEVNLMTGRKHQIRVQLASIGCPIKGDLKYGDKRSNQDGSISLMARHLNFVHPVSGKIIDLTAPVPAGSEETLWKYLESGADQKEK